MFKDEDLVSKTGFSRYYIYYTIPGITASCLLLDTITGEWAVSLMDGLRIVELQELLDYLCSKDIFIGQIVTKIGRTFDPGEVMSNSKDFGQSVILSKLNGEHELVPKKLLRHISDMEAQVLYDNKQLIN